MDLIARVQAVLTLVNIYLPENAIEEWMLRNDVDRRSPNPDTPTLIALAIVLDRTLSTLSTPTAGIH